MGRGEEMGKQLWAPLSAMFSTQLHSAWWVLHLLISGPRRKRTTGLLGSRENFHEFQVSIFEPSGLAASLSWLNTPIHVLEL